MKSILKTGSGSNPEAQGKHACEECHHPQMRLLPDGVFHCTACGSEVLPIETGRKA